DLAGRRPPKESGEVLVEQHRRLMEAYHLIRPYLAFVGDPSDLHAERGSSPRTAPANLYLPHISHSTPSRRNPKGCTGELRRQAETPEGHLATAARRCHAPASEMLERKSRQAFLTDLGPIPPFR